MQQQKENFLKIEDVAKQLNCSLNHVQTLFTSGRLKKTMIGVKSVRIKPEHFQEFLDSCEVS